MDNLVIINKFISLMKEKYGIDYLNDEHCLGILFYGSRKGNFVTSTSDLDLCIIYDDTIDYSTKGVEIVDGVDVEYFEKSISDAKKIVEIDYANINTASLSIYGYSDIIFEKNDTMKNLQSFTKDIYSEPFKPCDKENAKSGLFAIKNRMELLKKLAYSNDDNFDLIFYTVMDRIKTVYHKLNGITRLEISKAIRAYTSDEYAKSLLYDTVIDNDYKEKFITLLNSENLPYIERYKMLQELFEMVNNGLISDENRIQVSNKMTYAQCIPFSNAGSNNKCAFDMDIKDQLIEFIEVMNYDKDDNFMGLIIHGDNVLEQKGDQVEVVALFDDCDRAMYIGNKNINGISIKYVEMSRYTKDKDDKIVESVYVTNQYGYLVNPDSYFLMAPFKAEKENELVDYICDLTDKNKPTCTESKYKEELSVIRNRMKRLSNYSSGNNPYFDMYYSIILDKIINLYRKGISSVYISGDDYDNLVFLQLYKDALSCKGSKEQRLQTMMKLYQYIVGTVTFEDEYRIVSRKNNKGNILQK